MQAGLQITVDPEFPPTREELLQAFASFERAARQLSDSYLDLEGRMADLGVELEEARGERLSELREKEQLANRLLNLLKVLPGGVVVLDGSGVVRQCNPAALDLLGTLHLGEFWRDVVTRLFAPRWDDGHDITLLSGGRVNISTQALDGEPGQLILITDVTETRRLQEQLTRHKRLSAKGEMAAALAHQIRTPLSAALLYLSNLTRGGLEDTLRRRFAQKALDRLRHLERLVEDMLLFARGGGFETESVCVRSLLEDVVHDLAGSLSGSEFTVDIQHAAPGLRVRANRAALRGVLLNVSENALEACHGRGSLQILAARTDDGHLELRFMDDGPGIPAELRQQIFEPFFTTRAGGTGLGLAIAQSVIRAHGGEIALENVEPHGICCRVLLPNARFCFPDIDSASIASTAAPP